MRTANSAKAEADGRQNSTLDDDVTDAHRSVLANPLRLGTHEKTREDVVSEEEISAMRADGARRSMRSARRLM
jgi:hypothetical protein